MQTLGQILAEKCQQQAEKAKQHSEQNDIKMNHSNEHNNDFKNHSNEYHSNVIKLSKVEYAKIVSQLESWNVYKPKNLIWQEVNSGNTAKLKEAVLKTSYQLNKGLVKNAGAYFRKTLTAC